MDIVSYMRRAPRPASGRAAVGQDRVAWVDAAKGICIVLVVAMHATLGVGEATGGQGFMHGLVAFSKPFRMPDFFLVSGLFLSRVIDRDWRGYADKRVVHFVYFYVLWLVIQSALKYGQVSGGSPLGFLQHLAVSLVEPFSTLWFIHMLAIFSVVTKLLRRVPAVVVLAAAAALQMAPIESSSFVVHEFCERWVFFLAGYLLAPRIFALADRARESVGRTAAALALWAVANGALALTPSPVGRVESLAELPGVGLAAGLAGAMAIVALASCLTRLGLAGPLRYAGQNSIAIYLAFFLPMAATRETLLRTGLISDVGIISLVVTVAAVLVPLALERLSRGTRFSFLFQRPAWAHLPARAMAVPAQPPAGAMAAVARTPAAPTRDPARATPRSVPVRPEPVLTLQAAE